jgi:hypothetical protein
VHSQPSQQRHTRGCDQHPGGDQWTWSDAGKQDGGGDRRRRNQAEGHGHGGQAAFDRGEPQDLLQVVHQEQEDGEDCGSHDRQGEKCTPAIAFENDPEGKEWVLDPSLDEHEGGQQDHTRC